MKTRRVLALLMMVCLVALVGVYVQSVRAGEGNGNGKAAEPCDGGEGDNWKWGYCHQGHGICTGDANEVRNHTGHTVHGDKNPDNPPEGCVFVGCCSQGETDEEQCKKADGGGGK